ncbi:hypothetical protein E7681_17405 [Thalassobius vesicularis]|uniref:Uncharacterized protein n=1 Tax=Thalassobius vesicularis TaxID=1294297 RepID=A0A4S3M5T2_9RHOB|nr:hypothetical protein [Thalassobius vesicularis]THD71581.1 hypothetical protein E7681_17405 [Thalassobius vesicularis]
MTLGVPEAPLSCYMLFFAFRDNAGGMVFTGIKLIVAATVAIGLAIPLLNALIDAPMGRVLAIAAFTLGGMFLSQVSKLGPLAGTMGFVFAFALTLVDVIPIPELLTRGMAWMWVVIALPMFVMAVVAALIAPCPVDLSQAQIQRLRSAANHPHSPKARALLDEGLENSAVYIRFASLMGQTRGAASLTLAALQRRPDL